MEYLNNLLINTILYIVNQIKSQISSSVVHLSSGLTGIRTPGLDRHIGIFDIMNSFNEL
jgi:hypothetical protein